jgi:two-component system sensor histidine kinase CpxA
MKLRFSLFTRIMLWFFLNLIVISAALVALFNLQFRLEPNSPLLAVSSARIENVARAISDDVRNKSREERDAILLRYSEAYRLDFMIYANTGEKLAGKESSMPMEVLERIKNPRPQRPGPPGEGLQRPRPFPVFTMKTSNPTRYWAVVRIPVYQAGIPEPVRAALAASSESMTGNGLFFDPKPWLVIAAVVFGLSILLWLPFVRGLTKTIRQMTGAAEKIADERFDVRVDEGRSDELGRLGKAINHLAARLSGFVCGQKRFLGDISHELNSPLARMHFALSILEERVGPEHQRYIEDVHEEVRLMTNLVNELLAYSRAGMKSAEIRLERVLLRPLIEQIVERESANHHINIAVAENLEALANPELLSRALANLIRNAVRYAASAGPISVSANEHSDQIWISVADSGPGVPDEAIGNLFDPFYRLESDRARSTGGAGLGLAIVKTCIEACGGTVTARNRMLSGLEILITLKAPARGFDLT